MTSTVKPSKAIALAGVQALIAGTQKHLPNGPLTIGNATYTAASLTGLLQSLIDAMTKQNVARAAAKDALTALRDVQSRVDPVVQGYRELLVVTYGSASQTLADFGLAPRKVRAPLTTEQKAAVAAKRKATRIARGTMGPKAKLAIKGTTTTATTGKPATPVAAPPKPTS